MSVSKISVDLRQRTFSIEVPDDRVEAVLERVEALFNGEIASKAEQLNQETEAVSAETELRTQADEDTQKKPH